MGLEYKIYKFEDSKIEFINPDSAVEELVIWGCQGAIEVNRHKKELLGTDFVIETDVIHILGNAVVRNFSSRDKPYFETIIYCKGEPDTDVVERYGRFYESEPEVNHETC